MVRRVDLSSGAAHARSRAPYAVLFVCTGNIARSAAAEIIAAASVPPGSGLEFAGAGTGAVVGSGVASEVQQALVRRGLDVSRHRAQQLTGEMVRGADLVLAMEPEHRRWILDEWPQAVSRTFLLGQAARLLPERPTSGPASAGTESAGRESAGTPTSGPPGHGGTRPDPAEWLRHHGGPALPQDAIADPFRRGAAAGESAVERVEQDVARLVPRLLAWTGSGKIA